MEHGLDTGALAVVAACFVLWGLVSARFEHVNVSAPIAFLVLGLIVAHEPLSLIDVHITSTTVRSVAEITLALVLFSDASRVNVRELRADVALPVRLLGIGLPLTSPELRHHHLHCRCRFDNVWPGQRAGFELRPLRCRAQRQRESAVSARVVGLRGVQQRQTRRTSSSTLRIRRASGTVLAVTRASPNGT